jgi:HK97 family phage major capsid protein
MFTVDEAIAWLEENDFVAIEFEPASEERDDHEDEEPMRAGHDEEERKEHEERKANGTFLTRDAHSEFVNEDEGTVQLVVSTETPVERGFGQEVLSHAAGAVDLEYLNSGRAPLLLDHSFEKQIGVIKSVELDQANRKIRAVVKFGRNDDQSRSVFQDVVDGIRQNVSIGYKVHEMERDETDESGTTYRVTKWEPLEVSMVAVGADVNAMVGRQVEVQQSEQSKAAEKIRALGAAYKMKGEAEQAIEGGMSIEDFRQKIHSKFGHDVKETQMSDIGLTTKEQGSYSLRRALFALSNPGDRRAQEAAAFEFEVSNAASRSGSFVVPFEVAGPISRRDMTTSSDAGAIGESFREGDFIEALRNQSSVMRAGATMLTGLEGTIKIPRQSAITAAAFLTTEGVTTNEDDPTFDAVTMDAKMLGITSTATKLLLNTASIDVENLIRNDLTRSIATGMDLAGLSGAGTSGVPTGIRNTAGINTVDFAANGPTFAEIVSMESRVAQDNALMGSLFYVVNPADYGRLKTTEKATNTAEFIVDRDGLVNGYEVIRSSQVAEDEYYFMDGSSLLVGVFGPGVEITVDPFSEANKGLVNITATVAMDIAVRHPESFCLGANTLP